MPAVLEEPAPAPEVTLVGVGHVFDVHDALRRLVHRRGPGVVCVELDRNRYAALRQDEQGQAGFGLYGILARFQQRAAESLGTVPGEEMLTAVDAAGEIGARAALIDRDARQVFRRMWSEMGFREKLRFLWDVIRAAFASDERVQEEIDGLRGDYSAIMEQFAERYPSARRVLIDDRNAFMAERIREQTEEFDRVVAVVGDGHVDGIAEALDDLGPSVVRLEDLLEDDGDDGTTVGFTVEYGS